MALVFVLTYTFLEYGKIGKTVSSGYGRSDLEREENKNPPGLWGGFLAQEHKLSG